MSTETQQVFLFNFWEILLLALAEEWEPHELFLENSCGEIFSNRNRLAGAFLYIGKRNPCMLPQSGLQPNLQDDCWLSTLKCSPFKTLLKKRAPTALHLDYVWIFTNFYYHSYRQMTLAIFWTNINFPCI